MLPLWYDRQLQAMKKNETVPCSPEENQFFDEIKSLVINARSHAYAAVNSIMTQTYWRIGQRIVQQEQKGKERAEYGQYLIRNLSKVLSSQLGNGLSVANLKNFRQFYLTYPDEKSYTLCSLLTWSHIRLIMRLPEEAERDFYIYETHAQNWSVRQLERNIQSQYYRRLLSSQHPQSDTKIKPANDVIGNFIKDPYVMEFLGLPENTEYLESELESSIIRHLQKFLLELGKGFSFVARQMRVSTETSHFYIDLVFYNFKLKCFVLIDLKTTKLTHQDIGQMDMYVRMFDDLKREEGDNPTVGIIFCSDKDETVVKYSVLSDNAQIFASKYRTVLPSEKELEEELKRNRLTSRHTE